jgi:LacI family transcriptional regulator
MEGYKKAIADHAIKNTEVEIISCYGDVEANYKIIKDLLTKKNKPDGIIASVEKLTTPVYIACKDLELTIPNDLKLICFTNLQTALILDPPLTTITQPAFEMGKTAATILFKGIEKKSFDLSKERVVLPSVLAERLSTGNC